MVNLNFDSNDDALRHYYRELGESDKAIEMIGVVSSDLARRRRRKGALVTASLSILLIGSVACVYAWPRDWGSEGAEVVTANSGGDATALPVGISVDSGDGEVRLDQFSALCETSPALDGGTLNVLRIESRTNDAYFMAQFSVDHIRQGEQISAQGMAGLTEVPLFSAFASKGAGATVLEADSASSRSSGSLQILEADCSSGPAVDVVVNLVLGSESGDEQIRVSGRGVAN